MAVDGIKRMSWGAIIAGTLLALTLQFMLGLLGLGIGLSTVDATTSGGTPTASAFASASGLWTVAVVLIGLFFGAFAAGRLAGSPSRTDAALHGIITWATSTLVVVYLLTSGASAIVGGAFGALGGSIQSLASAATSVTPQSLDQLPEPLKTQARQLLQKGTDQAQQAAGQAQDQAQQAADQAKQATGEADLSSAISTIVAGLGENASPDERNAATQVIAQQAGIPQPEAEQRLQEFQQKYDAAVQKAREAADKAAQTVSTASFGAFIALLLGLVVGAIGGLVGKPKRVVY